VHGSRKQCKPLIENATTALENDGKKEKIQCFAQFLGTETFSAQGCIQACK